MKTIVAIAEQKAWEAAQKTGEYTQSTVDSTLEDVGFIHCSMPDQTLEIANRKYNTRTNLVLLYIDTGKVRSPVKFEAARSGRPGMFPHIYGPLNTDAVFRIVPLKKSRGQFELSTPVPL